LWRRPALPLARLRCVELLLFGGVTILMAWEEYRFYHLQGYLSWFADRDLFEMATIARQSSIVWFAVVVAYGMFVPNTGRRCALVAGGIALVALGVHVACATLDEALDAPRALSFLAEACLWLGAGLAVAVYGSHKISVLRREANEARRLGPYRLMRQLGAGGMGEVHLAEHALLRRPCAVKIIRPERAGDPETLARFEREVQATARLTHPNTVQVFDYGRAEDGTFYYAMEYLPGATLEDLVRAGGPFPPAQAVHFLRQVCGALAEAHKGGLIHRDLKPGNIIACERGGVPDVAKLLDFGIVGTADPSSGSREADGRSVMGTPAYMSPEQASAGAGLDARSDLYSLGAVAYFLLTGRPPFVRGTAKLMLAAHASDLPTRLDWVNREVPEDVSAVIMRCLEKDPSRRFQDVVALEAALGACRCAGAWNAEQAAQATRPRAAPGGSAVASPTSMERMAGFDM
jgi:serine/threonine-protein kinase